MLGLCADGGCGLCRFVSDVRSVGLIAYTAVGLVSLNSDCSYDRAWLDADDCWYLGGEELLLFGGLKVMGYSLD